MGRPEELFARLLNGGEAALEALIDERASEELYLDFKAATKDGASQRLEDPDRKNLAKAISGFGNTEGGVIVWGIECREIVADGKGDVARSSKPINEPQRFVSWLRGAVSGCTLPPHPYVEHSVIQAADADVGYVITLVPKSDFAPHQVIATGTAQYRYYIRAGSSFVPALHSLVAGLLGYAPQPRMAYNINFGPITEKSVAGGMSEVAFEASFALGLEGAGVVHDMYLSLHIGGVGPGSIGVSFPDPQHWMYSAITEQGIFTAVAIAGYRLVPGALAIPIIVQVTLKPPFTSNLGYRLFYGFNGSPNHLITGYVSPAELENAYATYRASSKGRDDQLAFQMRVLDRRVNPKTGRFEGL